MNAREMKAAQAIADTAERIFTTGTLPVVSNADLIEALLGDITRLTSIAAGTLTSAVMALAEQVDSPDGREAIAAHERERNSAWR